MFLSRSMNGDERLAASWNTFSDEPKIGFSSAPGSSKLPTKKEWSISLAEAEWGTD